MIIVTFGILLAIVLAVGATSGLFAEKSGTVNIAINGMMIGGGLIYWMLTKEFEMKGWMQLVGYIISILGGIVIGGIFALATITLRANQVIAGTAMNLLFGGIGLFIWKYKGGTNTQSLNYTQLRFGGESTSTSDFTYIFGLILILGIMIILISFLWLKFTPWGLRLKSAGENPQALDSQGISVTKTRYVGLLISGGLGALAGAMFVQLQQQFTGGAAGLGFVALAILIAGQWNIFYISISAFVFGMLYSVGTNLSAYFIELDTIQPLIQTTPFILALIVLVLTSKKSLAPAAVGVAYDKSKR